MLKITIMIAVIFKCIDRYMNILLCGKILATRAI